MAFIFSLSSIANTPTVPDGTDKVLHAVLYSGLGALLVRALAGGWRRRIRWGVVVAAVGMAVAYGASDELHQSFVPPRRADVLDVVADGVGAAIAACSLYGWDIIRGRHGL